MLLLQLSVCYVKLTWEKESGLNTRQGHNSCFTSCKMIKLKSSRCSLLVAVLLCSENIP